jgi:hypothetical protein
MPAFYGEYADQRGDHTPSCFLQEYKHADEGSPLLFLPRKRQSVVNLPQSVSGATGATEQTRISDTTSPALTGNTDKMANKLVITFGIKLRQAALQ